MLQTSYKAPAGARIQHRESATSLWYLRLTGTDASAASSRIPRREGQGYVRFLAEQLVLQIAEEKIRDLSTYSDVTPILVRYY